MGKQHMNHRTGETGRDHWQPSGSTLLLKQGPLEYIPQDCVQTALESLLGKRLSVCLGSLSSA